MNVSTKAIRKGARGIRVLLYATGTLILLAVLSLLLISTLDGPHSRTLANEASAAMTVRMIVTLQDEYMAAHAYRGFACELSLLGPIAEQRIPDRSLEFVKSGVQSGYKFSQISCGSDANRARVRYQVIAVPVERGKTGIRAFCADETGVIWYDPDGSPTNCLASRHALE